MATGTHLARPARGHDGPRQLTIGSKHDRHARFSPDGRTVAFISDRRLQVEEEPDAPKDPKEREDGNQFHLLPLDGGEARRLTDLPRGVDGFAWSPDGRSSWSRRARAARPARRTAGRAGSIRSASRRPPRPDYRFIDRLDYMFNGSDFIYDPVAHLWIVDAATGEARRLTDGPPRRRSRLVAGRPRIAFATRPAATTTSTSAPTSSSSTSRPAGDARSPADPTRSSSARPGCRTARRSPRSVAACQPNGYRNDIWLFAADGSDATPSGGRNISGRHDIMPGSAMNSDITPGEGPRLVAVRRRRAAHVPRADRRRVRAVADRDARRRRSSG